jgi:DNA-binding CsgD family transcriptional regulator
LPHSCICTIIVVMHIPGNAPSRGAVYTADTMCAMTTNRTPLRPIRIEEDLWAEFGRLVGDRNRSQVIREFLRWYVRDVDAALPTRPGDGDPDRPDDLLQVKDKLRDIRNRLVHSSKKVDLSPDEEEALSPLEFRLLLLMADKLSEAELAERLDVAPGTIRGRIRKLAAKIDAVGGVKMWVPDDPLLRRPTDG